jgi:hypothetical protein
LCACYGGQSGRKNGILSSEEDFGPLTGVLHKCCIREIGLKNMQMHIYSCLCIGIITVGQENKDVEIYIIDKNTHQISPLIFEYYSKQKTVDMSSERLPE